MKLCLFECLAIFTIESRLIGKRVVDFLLVLIELFSLSITAEALRAIIGSKSAISLQWGPVDPKFMAEGSPCTLTAANWEVVCLPCTVVVR